VSVSSIKKGYVPFLAGVFFAILFAIFFAMHKSEAIADFAGASSGIENVFVKYGMLFGLVFAFLSILLHYLLRGVVMLIKTLDTALSHALVFLVSYGVWFVFAIQLVFIEPRWANLAKAIIFFTGYPLLYASTVMLLLGGVVLFFAFKERKTAHAHSQSHPHSSAHKDKSKKEDAE